MYPNLTGIIRDSNVFLLFTPLSETWIFVHQFLRNSQLLVAQSIVILHPVSFKNVQKQKFVCTLQYSVIITDPIFTRQLLVTIFCIKFHEIQTNVLAVDTRSHTEWRTHTEMVST